MDDLGKRKVSFGKHKGKTFHEIATRHPDYVKWARSHNGNGFFQRFVAVRRRFAGAASDAASSERTSFAAAAAAATIFSAPASNPVLFRVMLLKEGGNPLHVATRSCVEQLRHEFCARTHVGTRHLVGLLCINK